MLPFLLLLAAQSASPPLPPPVSSPVPLPPPPPSNSGAERVLGPAKGGVDDSLGRAATRPLRDLNLMKPKVSPELAAIMAYPYAVGGLRNCRQLNGEVNRMTELVGPDVDDPGLLGKKGRSPVERLFDSAEGITGSLVPGQGIIRQLTGANKAARLAAASRLAGQFRRSYIKGVMKARGCRLVPPLL
jgi:hypothetical protein